jgi:ArsR family transcriptional regulator
MKDGPIQLAAAIFRLLSHPARLRILHELRRGEACVCHLQAALSRPQVYVSQQLHVLRKAGLIASRREGTFAFYRLVDSHLEPFLKQALGPIDRPAPIPGCGCPRCGGDDCSSQGQIVERQTKETDT